GRPGRPPRLPHPAETGEHGAEPLQRRGAVPELTPALGGGDRHPGGQVDEANRRGRLVPVLAARTASGEGGRPAVAEERLVLERESCARCLTASFLLGGIHRVSSGQGVQVCTDWPRSVGSARESASWALLSKRAGSTIIEVPAATRSTSPSRNRSRPFIQRP